MTASFTWPVECFPKIENAGKFPFDDRNFSKHYCSEHHHALHLYEYTGQIQLDDQEYEVLPGTMTLTPQYSNARYHLATPGYHYCIHFQKGFFSDQDIFSLPLLFNLGHHHKEAELRFLEIARLLIYAKQGTKEQAVISLTFQSFLLWLNSIFYNNSDTPGKKSNQRVEKAVDIIEEKLTEQLSVPEIAAEAKISQNYLGSLFRKQFGMTIPHYILLRRIEYARTLLAISDMKIKEVADKSGLPDAQYFNKQFRRIIGVSPSQYRAISQKKEG